MSKSGEKDLNNIEELRSLKTLTLLEKSFNGNDTKMPV